MTTLFNAFRKLTIVISLVGSCFAALSINLRTSPTAVQVEVGEAAYAQRKWVREVLEFVGAKVIESGVQWTLDSVFSPKEDKVAPATTARGRYIGSSFIATPVYRGQRVTLYLFATPGGEWWGWYSTQGRWQQMGSPPPFKVYRTVDLYRDSSGNLFSLPAS